MSGKKSLLLIGAGPTSALLSYAIAKNAVLKHFINIHVWEKSGGVGGRFATSRSIHNPECYADLGAQYLTLSLDNRTSHPYFDSLKEHNLIRPLDVSEIPGSRNKPRKEHYACKRGTASIVKHFFQQASINKNDIQFNHRVIKVNPLPSGKVEVTAENQTTSTFDFVISTVPVPQIMQIENFAELITDVDLRKKLEAVQYSTRFALALFFDRERDLATSKQPLNFIENDLVFRYWSIENLKRTGVSTGEPLSVVIHTSVNFGAENSNEDKEKLKPELLNKACIFLPEAANVAQDSVKCHKWKYSQVTSTSITNENGRVQQHEITYEDGWINVIKPFEGKPGCVKLNEHVYAAGDGLVESGIEGCIESAEKAILVLEDALSQ